ncbi:MAG TPA: HNH endonuclease [Vicinamibacteria bacterium]|nr:HNH endonuclease [Vicinamibacteria bacterium]
MPRSLLLNATYEPLRVITWQKAIVMLVKGKVEVVASYDRDVRGVSISLRLPSVLRLLRRVGVARRFHRVPFSRQNIYLRDRYRCQYCSRRFTASQLTFDHVIPASRGGRKEWENIVTCCIQCNRQKGGKLPSEAGLVLARKPRRPAYLPAHAITYGLPDVPASWRDYLAWTE